MYCGLNPSWSFASMAACTDIGFDCGWLLLLLLLSPRRALPAAM
jgi:hypothetical protein